VRDSSYTEVSQRDKTGLLFFPAPRNESFLDSVEAPLVYTAIRAEQALAHSENAA